MADQLFLDLPIQWHLSDCKHDQCGSCGSSKMEYIKKTHRQCKECGADFKLPVSGKKFKEIATAWQARQHELNPNSAA